MESNGKPGRIHMSESTAKLVKAGGKGGWVAQREDKIVAKGKGEMTTYWLNAKGGDASSRISGTSSRLSGASGGGGGSDLSEDMTTSSLNDFTGHAYPEDSTHHRFDLSTHKEESTLSIPPTAAWG